jgi:hypothetical protein
MVHRPLNYSPLREFVYCALSNVQTGKSWTCSGTIIPYPEGFYLQGKIDIGKGSG